MEVKMKLIKKGNRKPSKTIVWLVEKNGESVSKGIQNRGFKDRRKQFTCYDTTIEEIEKLILVNFEEK